MNIAVVDDTHADREVIRKYLNSYWEKGATNVAVTYFESGRRFLEEADPAKLDVVFLDIFIGDTTGIALAETIREANHDCLIVLCSVSKDFIHASYDLGVLYYLIKPYDYAAFEKVMRRVEAQVEALSHYIEVMVNRKMIRIGIDDILYVDKAQHSTQLHLKDCVMKVWAQRFAEVQDVLLAHPQYIRCFHCILINMKHAVKISGRDFVLDNGEQIPISRNLASEVHDKYTRFMFQNAFGGK